MYKILVTNDDGYESPALPELVRALSELATVYVAVPDTEQSGKSQSLTFLKDLKAEEFELEGADVAYRIDGTPADCVKWALHQFEGVADFDYVISGINRGLNVGSALYYSGTVSAAREGAMNGIHSIALSVESHEASNFEYICSILPELLEMSDRLSASTFINVNSPDEPMWAIKGVKIADSAPFNYGEHFRFRNAEDGAVRLYSDFDEESGDLGCDYDWVREGYIAVSPVSIQIADQQGLRKLNNLVIREPICMFMNVQEKSLERISKSSGFMRRVAKWAKCTDRLDLPAVIVEMHGQGRVVSELNNSLNRTELIETADFNALRTGDLEKLIESADEKSIFIAGLETHIGVAQTAREFLARGWNVTIIEDCCAAGTKRDHNIAIDNLRAEGCRIATSEAAIAEMLGSSRHQAYKAISAILED